MAAATSGSARPAERARARLAPGPPGEPSQHGPRLDPTRRRAPATPTTRGRFAVAETIAQPPGGFLGAWALHLTAHSDVLDDYGGGPGRVALHGRGGASFRDPRGTARSHGCIRVDDRPIRFLARIARPGTPVRITR